jgi:hypothetical protein
MRLYFRNNSNRAWNELRRSKLFMVVGVLLALLYFNAVQVVVRNISLPTNNRSNLNQKLKSKSSQIGVNDQHEAVVLLITPSPEVELPSLLNSTMFSGFFPGITFSDEQEPWSDVEQELIGSTINPPSSNDWRGAPEWIAYGFSSGKVPPEAKQRFSNTVASMLDHSQSVLLHTRSLQVTLKEWLEQLETGTRNITCVFARRRTVQEQIFSAMDSMTAKRLSAREYRDILINVYLPRIKDACSRPHLQTITVEFSAKMGWTQSPSIDYSSTFDTSQPKLMALLKEALTEDNEIHSVFGKSGERNHDDTWPPLVRSTTEGYTSIITASKSLKSLIENKELKEVAGSDGREPEYANGAIGLGRSITFFDATRPRILMVTKSPLQDMDKLVIAANEGGWMIKEIDPIKDSWFTKCRFRPTRAHQNVRWGLMASKLRALEMDEMKSLLYMDLDIVVTGRLRRLFDVAPSEYHFISEGGIQHPYLNAGFLFIRPNKQLLGDIIKYFETNPPGDIFHNLIDCTEMGLINSFFGRPDILEEVGGKLVVQELSNDELQRVRGRTARLPLQSTTLSVGRPDTSKDSGEGTLPLAFHFIRKDLCPKPWNVQCNEFLSDTSEPCTSSSQACFEWKRYADKCDTVAYIAWCRFRGKH